jgi:outer membrane protein OmpA-like peptidoglycan-associated protein
MDIRKTLVLIGVGLLLAAPLFGAGQQEGATELEMPPQPRQYISPANDDGVNDELQLPFSTIVVQSENVVIVEYNLTIFDADGNVVWTESQVEEGRVGFFGRLFGAEKPQVEVPETLTWDGTYQDSDLGEDGEAVEDGDYTYQLFVRDDQENISRTPPFNVTVDNEAPEITELGPPEFRVFSPNDDGNRDVVNIPQNGSRELSWTGTITNADGDPVWEQTWANPASNTRVADITPPSPVTWDGTYQLDGDQRNGERVPEGAYSYTLASTDRAGNSTERTADWRVSVSLQAGEVELALAADDAAFSPNGDGRQDELPFTMTVLEPEGVASWELEVRDPDRRNPVVRRVTGEAPVPPRGSFDGRDEEGVVLPDGTYEATLYVQYENGTIVSSQNREIIIDTAAPRAQLTVDTAPQSTAADAPLVFGGTRKPELTLSASVDPDVDWSATIGAPGDTELTFDLAQQGFEGPDIDVRWDGRGLEGTEAPDGEYTLQLSATDSAGNRGQTREVTAVKFTEATPIDLTVDGNVITPNGDGIDDTVTIRPEFEVEEYIDDFLLEIRNADGELVRSVYRNQPFDEFTWGGENNAGGPVADGEYTVDFQIIYYNGNEPQITGVGPVYVDRTLGQQPGTPANLEMTVTPLPFSPDGDGVNDTLTIELRTRSRLPIEEWSVEITEPNENGFKTWSGDGEPPRRLTWDGTSDDGELVQSAVNYTATFSVVDSEGNESEVERVVPTDILVIREGDRLRIRIPSIHFASYSSDFFASEIARQEENFRILRRLATVLDRYPDYQILIEGHANHVLYQNEQSMRREQRQSLIPLSRNRAQEVKEALIILGLDRERMDIEGVGGARPVVPFSDKDNIWKNRRVEFILER